MMTRQKVILAAAGLLAVGAASAIGQSFALHDGDTVVFYGDSITAQRLYTRYVEEAVVTRYPGMHVRFVNAGVPGDTVYGGYAGAMAERVERDVLPYKPTMVAIMLGMNDGGYVPYSAKIDAVFRDGYSRLVETLHKKLPDACITLLLPTPYDEVTHGTDFPGYAAVVEHNAADVRELANNLQLRMPGKIYVADLAGALGSALERARRGFPQQASWIVPDRIHPAEAGHWIMAAEVLRAWNFDPVVSSLRLYGGKVETLEKVQVRDLVVTPRGLTWTSREDSLPLPLTPGEPVTDLLLNISAISSLDVEELQISRIMEGTYDLTVDGKVVATVSSAALDKGVNLGLLRTPMLDQARGVDWWEQRRSYLEQAGFILNAETKVSEDTPAASRALIAGQAQLAASAVQKLTPLPHHFEIRRKN